MEGMDFLQKQIDKNEQKTERLAEALIELSKSHAVSNQVLSEMSETLREIRKELAAHHDTLVVHKSLAKTIFHVWTPVINIIATGALAAYQFLIKG